ncbi:hypothetical protein LX64_03215 [Chitinophaga skermanii]|uniref:Calcineurin-like phosphoesterase domain-containing protein n=1 Tax=Chitinophaga skermanii TaxID=331697 RepID=A0A327QC31_9BACT|nr:metallophosphoesterase [Chitinophaga skermanii]RAJ02206.1 hypothetical protein LX64_03215 [Chitinophaga skermanii]
MRQGLNYWIFVLLMFMVDLYVFMGVRAVVKNTSSKTKKITYTAYWTFSIIIYIILITFGLKSVHWELVPSLRSHVITLIMGQFFAKAIVILFMIIDDIRRFITWIIYRVSPPKAESREPGLKSGITRSQFLTRAGMFLGGGLFATLAYGFSNKYNYHIRRVKLHFSNLPSAWKGLKIVQISDIHSGSFNNKQAVEKGVAMINAQNADIVFFTGDLVNDRAIEMQEYMGVFNKVKAPMGVYSTLGNHDYGDYFPWPDRDANGNSAQKAANLEQLKAIHGELGWQLMMNENKIFTRNGQQLAVVGIENWSANPRFPRKGDMPKAMAGTEQVPFKILLSHDPTHWDAEVRPVYPSIDLMLAGHTHGMQFGIEIPYFKWSPAQYLYKQWAGLYKEKRQVLYVNRGFGFLGYPGRVGILPEITVIELV